MGVNLLSQKVSGSEDGYKRVNGRKRHLLVDTQGFLLEVAITAANISDLQPVLPLLARAHQRFDRLQIVWVDQAYTGLLRAQLINTLHIRLQVATRSRYAVQHGPTSPHRWVVERTFAWLGRYRRLCKGYEYLAETSRAMIFAACSRLLLRRLARPPF